MSPEYIRLIAKFEKKKCSFQLDINSYVVYRQLVSHVQRFEQFGHESQIIRVQTDLQISSYRSYPESNACWATTPLLTTKDIHKYIHLLSYSL